MAPLGRSELAHGDGRGVPGVGQFGRLRRLSSGLLNDLKGQLDLLAMKIGEQE